MKQLSLLFIGFMGLLASSCKNDVELNAPYKEIPSIYAVMDPTASEQMVRINKVFLGEGDANLMAKIADSVNYAENELEVKLERFVNNKKVQASKSRSIYDDSTDIFFTERMIETQEGSFNTNQRVYVTNHLLYDEGVYQLTVKNKTTGNSFTAKSTAVKPVSVATFSPLGFAPYYPYPANAQQSSYIDYSLDNPKPAYEIRYPVNESYLYQLVIRYHINDSIFGQTTERTVDYNAGTHTLKEALKLGSSGTNYISHTFGGAGIFNTIGNAIAKYPSNILGRRLVYMEYIVFSASVEYADYLDYIKPSFGLNQTKPLYSNFEGKKALGLFTFRTQKSVSKQPSTYYINKIAEHPSTCNYKFYNQFLIVSGCNP